MKVKLFRNKKILTAIFALVLIGVAYLAWPNSKSTPSTASRLSAGTATTETVFNKNQYSQTDPNSIWVIVNKKHPLNPVDYAPTDLVFPNVPLRVQGNQSMQLRQVTARALERMFSAAKIQGVNLQLSSGYRSYTYQVNLYNGYVRSDGQAKADQESARPGYSEHQTGLAVDLEPPDRKCELQDCFATSPEGEWLYANAYKYGFILRYTTTDQPITGYESEPWHFRYVGDALANRMHQTQVSTLEQFFDFSGGSTYSP